MNICFLPIDNRPVCYNLARDIASIDSAINLLLPPRDFLGDLTKTADIDSILDWLKNLPHCDAIILSLDTITYGGLIPSRRSKESFETVLERINTLKAILKEKKAKIYAFSSIMRISNNNYNEEEKEYWSQYGKKIFEYSYNIHKNGSSQTDIPTEILDDYLSTRKRNFEINKTFLSWEKEGLFNTLIFSKDDCAEFGLNVLEAIQLEKMGAKTKTGADEIPLSLLSRAINKKIKVFVEFTEPTQKDLISNYEDCSIEKSVQGQLELGGFLQVFDSSDADIILVVNNFVEKQGELVMGWDTEPYSKTFIPPNKPYAIADVRFANGADNKFAEQVLNNIDLENFYGYSAWNTSANTLGSLLACVKTRFEASDYNKNEFKKIQAIRFLDDWAYQANIRGQIKSPTDIKNLMQKYENKVLQVLNLDKVDFTYSYPWNRKFEIEINIR